MVGTGFSKRGRDPMSPTSAMVAADPGDASADYCARSAVGGRGQWMTKPLAARSTVPGPDSIAGRRGSRTSGPSRPTLLRFLSARG